MKTVPGYCFPDYAERFRDNAFQRSWGNSSLALSVYWEVK